MRTRNHSEVLVIGGGVVGLACDHYLAREGRGVRVVGEGCIGRGASHGNCGLVFISDLAPLCAPGAVGQEFFRAFRRTSPLYIQPALDFNRMVWLLKFALMCRRDHVQHTMRARARLLKSSGLLFEELFRENLIDAEYDQRGVLLVYRSESTRLA